MVCLLSLGLLNPRKQIGSDLLEVERGNSGEGFARRQRAHKTGEFGLVILVYPR
jgi:hypothetical protein